MGGGCRPSQGHGEGQFRGAAEVLGASLQGYHTLAFLGKCYPDGGNREHMLRHPGCHHSSVTGPTLQPCPGHLASHSCFLEINPGLMGRLPVTAGEVHTAQTRALGTGL